MLYVTILIELSLICAIQSTGTQECICPPQEIQEVTGEKREAEQLTSLKGDAGIDGPKGEKGDTGHHGKYGPVGLTGNKGLPGNKGHHGEKGAMGLTGDKGLKGDLGRKGDKGEHAAPIIQKKSAFSVVYKTTPGKLSASDPMKYNHVITNIGNHYDKKTGKFVCQYPGTYIFHYTSQKKAVKSGNYMGTIIKKNGDTMVSSYGNGIYSSSASNLVVLSLGTGDEVWTQPLSSAYNEYYSSSNHYCTFSGYLLYSA
ncbi:otolin-1-A-like [Antedon mediterranea]|uniref:otolin-1-A-like n=1 Tax=Antedon mediterranea TaxID=105859 RepID=UPI003AF846BA